MSQCHHRMYPDGYVIPKKNILLFTCIDLRLMDEIVHFMEYDNLTNRYDQFTLAGASLTTQVKKFSERFKEDILTNYKKFSAWNEVIHQHIEIAKDLHKIEDVYIIEHRNCGAYKEFLKNGEYLDDKDEKEAHLEYAALLCEEIKTVHKLHAHSFLMDLRGNIELLHSTNPS